MNKPKEQPVSPGKDWVSVAVAQELQAKLDACKAENKGLRRVFRRVQEALFGPGKTRKEGE